ncbi:permease [Candidatus Woesearchaeota archaeon]|nr:permease [Candidatus Woesearchaeota archaeon]
MPLENFIVIYVNSLFELARDLWLYFLLGLIISALIQEFVSTKKLLKYFGGNDIGSLLRATTAGLFVSVCSCGAIPIAATLRQRGASTASALTFLLAAPWGGLLHVLLISGFIGIKNTVILLIFSLLTAFIAGLILAKLENKNLIEIGIPKKHKKGEKHICVECVDVEKMRMIHEKERFEKRIVYCVPKNMRQIFREVGKYIVIGLLIAAALKAFAPSELVVKYLGNGGKFLPVLIAVPISAVLELASEGLAVLGGQLYQLGASLGVVFVILMVGVATDITELSMIWGKFGKRSSIAYLLTATAIAILFALMINLVF